MIMSVYGCNMNLELQQRAVEYNAVIKNFPNLRDGLFEQMPPIEMKERYMPNQDDSPNKNGAGDEELLNEEEQKNRQNNKEEVARTLLDLFEDEPSSTSPPVTANHSTATTANSNILDLFDTPAVPAARAAAPATAPTIAINPTSANMDLLFGLDSKATAPPPVVQPKASNQDIMDLFGSSSTKTSPSSMKPAFNGLPAVASSNSNLDDIFGNLNPKPTSAVNGGNSNDLLSMFMSPAAGSTPAANFRNETQIDQVMVVYDKNDLRITMEPDNSHPNDLEQAAIKVKACNTSVSNLIKEVLFSSAVPKNMTLQLSPPTTKIIHPMDSMAQIITISNPSRVSFRVVLVVFILFEKLDPSFLF